MSLAKPRTAASPPFGRGRRAVKEGMGEETVAEMPLPPPCHKALSTAGLHSGTCTVKGCSF